MAKNQQEENTPKVLEQGNIYFMYRPRVQQDQAEGMDDVQRFYMALKPEGRPRYRLIVIGRKHLPDIYRHERVWGFVDIVSDKPTDVEQELRQREYQTKTRGKRTVPAARPAGEGNYAIIQLNGQMHLVYALELPDQPADVQRELRIAPQASFALSVKNPEKGQPANAGLPQRQKADYPREKQEVFRGRHFEGEDPEMLDYQGTEFMLVGARERPQEDYGLDLEPEQEDARTADIIKDLHMTQSRHPVEPLLKGQWR